MAAGLKSLVAADGEKFTAPGPLNSDHRVRIDPFAGSPSSVIVAVSWTGSVDRSTAPPGKPAEAAIAATGAALAGSRTVTTTSSPFVSTPSDAIKRSTYT